MSDIEERHEPYQAQCGIEVHEWEITVDDGDETVYLFRGTKRDAKKEMQRIFDDTFDGGITNEGYEPREPTLTAHCPRHDITLFHN